MALYLKQDFNPPMLSKKWVSMKFRPNLLLYSRQHIISILESGLLFREDSIEVEQETASGDLQGGGPWFTAGERIIAAAAVTASFALCPPRSFNRTALIQLAAYLSLPVAIRLAHRRACQGTLPALLAVMRDYLTLARRALACLRECAALRAELGSVASCIESTHAMLCRQQSELAVTMSRTSSALLGNAPWLRSDVAWDALPREDTENLMKVHHAFLVVQSTLLKHIAMAHVMPSLHAHKLYKNHNERIYWIHSVLIQNLTEEFTQNFEALERMYRLLKNYGNADQNVNKRPGAALNSTWLYSDVHSDIARANLELKLALNKCNNLDMFLDSCALEKQQLDLEILNKDIDNLIGNITKCLATAQSSQIRLRKLMGKFKNQVVEVENVTDEIIDEKIVKIDDREPETKDEVFYFVKTEDDDMPTQGAGDITTCPGKKERETTKIVLNELRRKLVNREDFMRERERQALAKTMPELKDNVPEFPRQIKFEDFLERKGYIKKLKRNFPKKRLFREKKIQRRRCSYSNLKTSYRLRKEIYKNENDIEPLLYEANEKLSVKSKLISFDKLKNKTTIVTLWHKDCKKDDSFEFSDLSEGLSDIEGEAANKNVYQAINLNNRFEENLESGEAVNYRFSKRDLELTPSSESESEADFYFENKAAVLKDMRRYRAARKKNYPDKRANPSGPSPRGDADSDQDEGSKPARYSLGAGLAMASVLRARDQHIPAFVQEEVYIADGEVSEDSGHDDD